MQISHQEYLENQLYSKKMELKETDCQYRVVVAEFRVKREFLNNQIDSIEKQLSENKD